MGWNGGWGNDDRRGIGEVDYGLWTSNSNQPTQTRQNQTDRLLCFLSA